MAECELSAFGVRVELSGKVERTYWYAAKLSVKIFCTAALFVAADRGKTIPGRCTFMASVDPARTSDTARRPAEIMVPDRERILSAPER